MNEPEASITGLFSSAKKQLEELLDKLNTQEQLILLGNIFGLIEITRRGVHAKLSCRGKGVDLWTNEKLDIPELTSYSQALSLLDESSKSNEHWYVFAIVEWLVRKGDLTQKQIAASAGLSEGWVSRYLNGEAGRPRSVTLVKLRDFCVDFLMDKIGQSSALSLE